MIRSKNKGTNQRFLIESKLAGQTSRTVPEIVHSLIPVQGEQAIQSITSLKLFNNMFIRTIRQQLVY